VFLDFSKPPLIDLTNQPSSPTPNNSNFFISAETEGWSTSLRARLNEFVAQRRTVLSWIHRKGAYDALLLVVGLPAALWGSYRFGGFIPAVGQVAPAIEAMLYVYLFLLLISAFRALFSYSRWAFPRIEFDDESSAVIKHRAVLFVILLGVVGSAMWDAIKSLL
jgi:hypothetical protein